MLWGRAMRSLLCLLIVCGACAEHDSASDPGTIPGKGDGIQATVLEFDVGYGEALSGPLVAGERVVIRYAPERLPQCRTTSGGADGWGISGFLLSESSPIPRPFPVTELRSGKAVAVDAVVEIPEGDHIELYFQVTDVFGCTAYDSDFGQNYRFIVEQSAAEAAVVSFESEGEPVVMGELRAGGSMVLHYEPERLADCSASQGGVPQWGITAYVESDTGEVSTVDVARAQDGSLVAADPSVALGAGDGVALWFEATNAFGCFQRDPEAGSYQLSFAE